MVKPARTYTTAACLALVSLFISSLATPAYSRTATYYLDRVVQSPAEILLVPGFLTILEFEDDVSTVATGNPSIVELVDVTGRTILLRPKAGSGTTDIVVSVGEATALFLVRVASRPRVTHKYRIVSRPSSGVERERGQEPPAGTPGPTTQTSTRTPAPAASPKPQASSQPAREQPSRTSGDQTEWDGFVSGLNREQKALLVQLMRSLTLSDLFRFLQSLSPEQRETFIRLARIRGLPAGGDKAPATAQPPQPAQQGRTQTPQPPSQATTGPEWIEWDVSVQRTPHGTVLQYTIFNNGDRMVLADVLRLRVSVAGTPAKYTLTRTNASGYLGRIGPGGSETGTILLHEEPGTGPVTLEWRLVEVGSGVTYTIIKVLQ